MKSVRKSTISIWIIMLSMTLITLVVCLGIIYFIIVKSKKADLQDLCINQQNIIKSIYRETNDKTRTLEILQEYFKNNPSFGKTGEFYIAYLNDDSIRYLMGVRHPPYEGFHSIPFVSDTRTPMTIALSGNTGSVFGRDYRDVRVLAYCTFIPDLGWGLVAKMDLKEVMIPFFRAGLFTLLVSLILIIIGMFAFIREFNPILEKVLRSETRFRNLFEYSAVPIWEINTSGIKQYSDRLKSEGVTDLNSYFEANKDEIKSLVSTIDVISVNKRSIFSDRSLKNLVQYLNENSVNVLKKMFIGLSEGITHIDEEIEFVVDGQVKSFLAHVSVMPGHESDLSEVLISFVDITKHKEIEEKLLKNEARLNRSQEIAHLGSWELDLVNDRLFWTDEVYRIFGLTPREEKETYEGFLNAIHPDDREKVDNAFSESIMNNLDGYNIEHRIIREKTGEVRYVHEKCDHFKDSNGRIIRSVGMVHDITDRKKAEVELLGSKQKLTMALENGKIGIWEWDPNTDKLELDAKVEEMFGLEPGSYEQSYSTFESMIYEDDLSHLRIAIRNSLKKNIPLQTIFRIKSRSGKTRYISARATTYRDDSGNPELIMSGVAFDLTDFQERTEMMVSQLNEELLRSNKELEEFAYVASHDLQEPLRMVSSFTQLLEMQYGDKLDDRARDFIGFAVDGAKRMYDLLNGLLSYSRINTRGEAFSKVDLTDVFETTLQNLSLKIKESRALITSVRLPVVYADKNQMIQLFQNLITNSIKFSRGEPKIHISFRSEKGHNLFLFRDEGIGIDPIYFDKIFKIFQRLHGKGEFEGTGIGLAICKRIVERHGGNIWVESRPDKGAKFFFTLPKSITKSGA